MTLQLYLIQGIDFFVNVQVGRDECVQARGRWVVASCAVLRWK
jgi:hypothetical protein